MTEYGTELLRRQLNGTYVRALLLEKRKVASTRTTATEYSLPAVARHWTQPDRRGLSWRGLGLMGLNIRL